MPDDPHDEDRLRRAAGMARDLVCADCGRPGVLVHRVPGPAATWTTWDCRACGYELREHVRTRDRDS